MLMPGRASQIRSSDTPVPQPVAMPTAGEVADEVARWAIGGAILTFALVPFAVPMIALTIIALVPLLVLGLAAGLVVAVIAAPVVIVRRRRRLRPVAPAAERERPQATIHRSATRDSMATDVIRAERRTSYC
jgi:hypothetical protein